MTQGVFLNYNPTVATRVSVYHAICLSVLLYGSDTEQWTQYIAAMRHLWRPVTLVFKVSLVIVGSIRYLINRSGEQLTRNALNTGSC